MNSFKVLVAGLGIGRLYKKILSGPEYIVETFDINSSLNPTYDSLEKIPNNNYYDLIIICTPNYTHESIYLKLQQRGRKFLIEKPGFSSYENWQKYDNIYLVKNNMYRDILSEIKLNIKSPHVYEVKIKWINKNRIPNPGSWFTQKDKSYGGVSMDLIPHLLSIYAGLSDELNFPRLIKKVQSHTLDSLKNTDYGKIEKDGYYNVDDFCHMQIVDTQTNFILTADWKSDGEDFIGVELMTRNMPYFRKYDFGLCPEEEYLKMINDILFETNIIDHKKVDKFIHLNIH